MPAGDAQRTWFPELAQRLRERWSPSLTLDELIALSAELDLLLQEVRSGRGILPPMHSCRGCHSTARAAPPRVSVRAVLFALGRYGIASAEVVSTLDKQWARRRKAAGLDLFGKAATPRGR